MELAVRLRTEARVADERRLLVLAGDPGWTRERARTALDAAEVADPLYVGTADFPAESLGPRESDTLLGTTREAVVLDCHDDCRPNAIGRAVGAVDGGGLLLLLTPPLADWPDRRDAFDAGLAVPPFDVAAVTGRFRRRLVDTLRAHRGVAIVTPEGLRRDGLTDPPPRRPTTPPTPPPDREFPRPVYDACRTADQAAAVAAFEGITEGRAALVVESDRGRGKSSAAGLAAGALAAAGADVLVTAPAYPNAREVFARAESVLAELGVLAGVEGEPPRLLDAGGGRVRFEPVERAVEVPDEPDLVVVDEAAALPVARLERFLAADAVAFATTVHGYEGAGRGFDVRFRDALADADHAVTDVRLADPIRYAPGDPVEVWAFRALALGATPAVDPLVAGATPETVSYRRPTGADLVADEHRLRETFGLLVLAHYRTEPNDLARLLDGPNVSVRVLTHDGHVVSVALLAREGGLPAETRARMYEGERVRGNMVPDVLTTQLRDEAGAVPVGWRVLRVATHAAARSRGLGSLLLDRLREEAAETYDYLSVGYGATPELLRFWRRNGFSTVHLSTSRNATSGEHSAVMLDPLTDAGRALCDRHTDWFLARVGATLSDPLADADPDVVRGCLRATAGTAPLSLSAPAWRTVVGAAEGAAVFDTAPGPFRRLTLRYLTDGDAERPLDAREERLLVAKALQGRSWERVAAALDYPSAAECKRALGRAGGALADLYGGEAVRTERERFR
jgi:tRNA(Met) cytidine acetyltransferase